MAFQTYDSDLTDDEWSILSDVWPPRSARGAPARWSTREIVNAVLYDPPPTSGANLTANPVAL